MPYGGPRGLGGFLRAMFPGTITGHSLRTQIPRPHACGYLGSKGMYKRKVMRTPVEFRFALWRTLLGASG